jgi:hypothetical protein
LHLKHGGISGSERNEFSVATFFHQATSFQHNDAVCHADSRKAVGDKQRHFAEGEFSETLEDFEFTTGIERGGGFVED